MSSVEIINRTTIAFEKGELKTLNLGGGYYSANFTIECTDGKVFEFKFTNTAELKTFVETIVLGAMKMDWDSSYPSSYSSFDGEAVTIEKVCEWRDEYVKSTTEPDPMTY